MLVCTTIIETGIDIPNANTIIIENADHFGLSQLYQIKGRVGRSDKLAYAYLLFSQNKQVSEVASNRLRAIKEFTELGSGYKIALRDLSIRGAGDLLGANQSGFIENIGIDLYMDLLKEAIEEEKGINKEYLLESIETALVTAYKRNFDSVDNVKIIMDPVTGDIHVYSVKEIVEQVENPKLQIVLEEAKKVNKKAKLGEIWLTAIPALIVKEENNYDTGF